jgi:hypothetical protein
MELETVRRPALTDSCRWSACVAGRTEHRMGRGHTEIACERSQALCPTAGSRCGAVGVLGFSAILH